MGKLLIPENDLQELWELNGRVKAVLAMAGNDNYDGYTKNDVLAAMLGVGQPHVKRTEVEADGGEEKQAL